MKINAEDILNYHCPRWNELPEIELYIDQVISIIQNNLSIFNKDKTSPIITSSMINNYVKNKIISAPIKKKYNREHLAHLFVICIFKRLMSISEINESITLMKKIYSVEDGYNIFCNELEDALQKTFNSSQSVYKENEIREIATLKAIVNAFAQSVLVDRLILLRNK